MALGDIIIWTNFEMTRKYPLRGYLLGLLTHIVIYCFSFTSLHGPQESEGDPEYIFFTHNTYQATFLVTFCYTTAGIGNLKV